MSLRFSLGDTSPPSAWEWGGVCPVGYLGLLLQASWTFQSIASWMGLLVSFTILDHPYEEQLSDHSGAFRVHLSPKSPQLAPHL